MKHTKIVLLKTLTWILCLWPLALLIWGAVTNNLGPDATSRITLATGSTTLNLLTLSLAVTPLRRLIKPLAWIGPWRKILGLFAFFYATLHLFTWIALYTAFDPHAMTSDIVKRRFITVGMITWLLMLPLAATSFNWAIKKMGGKRWKRLHKLVYVAAVCGIIHYWWGVKTGVISPLPLTIAVGLLLLARPVLDWIQDRKPRPAYSRT